MRQTPKGILFRLLYSTHTGAYIRYTHKHMHGKQLGDGHGIFAGRFWQDMKRDKHKKVIMRKETKRIGSFFPPSV